ncbi:2-C-methyl-D-erythritol 4-phosphate cytidylyltransferase [Sinomonas sp. P47F7]|uniref:2-C-methyl-D-erythritol 4-phosphate cytidylyltransferase n=1 Tax=Sinomonas sp. P47F7 TaxID=3410987 RepID=UPI003BF45E7E
MTPANVPADASPEPPLAVVVVAAGAGTRLGHGIPKALVPVAGEPMLAHALRGAVAAGIARQLCVAVPADDDELAAVCRAFAEQLAATGTPLEVTVVRGGQTRADSVRAALGALLPGTAHVLVHDAARPFTPPEAFRRVATALRRGAAAVIPAVPVVDTIKSVAVTVGESAYLADEIVTGTPAREQLRAVQTPQGFDAETLRHAHETASGWPAERAAAITDDAMLIESLGLPVYVVPGDARSLKITTPMDLRLAEMLVEGACTPQEAP